MRFLLLIFAAMILAGCVLAAQADPADDYVQSEMAKRHIPAVSFAVIQNGKVDTRGYGLANVELAAPATAQSVYELGSLTKQFTAAAILLLAQTGKVGLDEKIGTYLSSLPAAWRSITVRNLLNQTSGIPNYRAALDLGALLKDYSAADVIRMAAKKPLLFAPGSQFAYSNTNYHLLGMIVEKASGQSYGDFVQERLFAPLNMTQTRLNDPGAILPGRVRGYAWDGTALNNNYLAFSPTIDFGDSGIVSTAGDLAKWEAALEGDQLLNAASKAVLWTPPILKNGRVTEYAAGWMAAEVQGHHLLWHNGAVVAGFSCAMFRFPDDKLTLIVLTNALDSSSPPAYSLTLGLAKIYLPALAAAETPISDPDPKTTQALREILTDLGSGKLDTPKFTPQMQSLLAPDVLAQTQAGLAALGPLKSFELLGYHEDAALRYFRYRAVYGETSVIWKIALTKSALIAGILWQPE